MTKQEYVETLWINGLRVDVGLDDYGQCYFYEYIDEQDGPVVGSCGTYNLDYREYIYSVLDVEYKYMKRRQLYGEGYDSEILSNPRLRDVIKSDYAAAGIHYEQYAWWLAAQVQKYKKINKNFVDDWILKKQAAYQKLVTHEKELLYPE